MRLTFRPGSVELPVLPWQFCSDSTEIQYLVASALCLHQIFMECLLRANCYGDQTGPRLWELRVSRRRERLRADSLTPHSTVPVHRYSLSMLSNRSSASRWCDSRFYTEEVQGAGWGDSGRIRASKEAESGGLLQDAGGGWSFEPGADSHL